MGLLLIVVAAGVIVVGTEGIAHGIKWTFHNRGCIAKHGVKFCRATQPTVQGK